ncbi:MAG TPA: cytochrome c oxidase subunit II [Tepidiformaceae bacterium]|nr:cytochrome c oxidase subunit II [Thermoflexaceae bacterium]HMS57634.1 cytochrome c oxidase subunit II [Tepidiformaceae bacterium]
MSKHLIPAALLWVVLTAIGEATFLLDWLPVVGSPEAEEWDLIFNVLLAMGIPVFTFVVAALVYAFTNFKTSNDGVETGATFKGTGMFPKVWLVATSALVAVAMVIGLVSLSNLQADKSGYGWGEDQAPLVIETTAQRFSWTFSYKDKNVELLSAKDSELLLPIDTEVKFELNSIDVIHSLWIPAFRMKIDAIPGRTTFLTVEPHKLGSFETDENFRVQCAELCGLNHTIMSMHIRVVEQAEFDAWLASKQAKVSR